MRLDHVTIRTADPETTLSFFLTLFDALEEGPRPAAIRRIPGHWLYAGGEPIVHIIGVPAGGPDQSAEAWDHVGFRLSGYEAFRSRLDTFGVPYSAMELPELNERRLFVRTPLGPIIETVFRDIE